MILTGPRLAIIGEALAATSRFKAPLARLLVKSPDTIDDYVSGKTNVPRPVRKQLAILCATRGAALMRIALELDPTLQMSIDATKTPGKTGADSQ